MANVILLPVTSNMVFQQEIFVLEVLATLEHRIQSQIISHDHLTPTKLNLILCHGELRPTKNISNKNNIYLDVCFLNSLGNEDKRVLSDIAYRLSQFALHPYENA